MDRERLQTYASLAEVISAVAIIISLLYVGYEVRRTSTLSSREADVILFERGREANRILIESPGMAEIVVAAGTAPDRMSAPDRLRYLAYQHDFFDTWEIAWYHHADGILDRGGLAGLGRMVHRAGPRGPGLRLDGEPAELQMPPRHPIVQVTPTIQPAGVAPSPARTEGPPPSAWTGCRRDLS